MLSQILSISIFALMFVAIIRGKSQRYLPALWAALAMIVLVFLGTMHSPLSVAQALNLSSLVQLRFWYSGQGGAVLETGINWATIVFIAGMMVMVEGMEDSGFFRWLCLRLAKLVDYNILPLFVCFMLLSAVLSMFIDSITVILFLAAVSIELAQLLHFDPVPFILAQIFTANLGGAATMSGDPPNIIIGTALGLEFSAFLENTGVLAWLAMLLIVPFFYFCFRKTLKESERARDKQRIYPSPSSAIASHAAFAWSVLVFALTVVLLLTHAQTGLSLATVGVIAALLTLCKSLRGARSIGKRLDWRTLVFFMGLFVVVSGLEQTGVLNGLSGWIARCSGGNPALMLTMILWLSAIASAFVDNIPLAATMVPVIRTLAVTQGIPIETLAWTLSLATDLGGSATPIGASANVVGTAIAAKQGYPISWGTYCSYAVPATVMVLGVSLLGLLMRYL